MLLLIQGLGNLLEDRSGINVYLGSASKTLFHVHLINLLNCCPGILLACIIFFSFLLPIKVLLRDPDTF